MRILLAHNSLYFPSHGGGDKSNRLLMEALAARGHSVRVVARVERFGPEAHRELGEELALRGIPFAEADGALRFERNGVDVRTLTVSPHLRAYFAAQIAEFDPGVIVTSTDDPAQLLFELALRANKARVVYLVRATIAAPFGPDSSMLNAERTAMLRNADGVVGVSEYVAGYARHWGELDAVHLPISLMEHGADEVLGRFHNPYITFVNPCAVKGIAIFLGLAASFPKLQFAAVPSWGTTTEEMASLRTHSNVDLLSAVDDIGIILRRTRVVLVPSIWAEARSRMVMESMCRGIPVMASDVGGLKEAKLGVPYLLPVNPVTHYRAAVDGNMVPVAEVPPQDLSPWREALGRLTGDEEHWSHVARASRAAALAYLQTLTVEPFEAYLEALLRKPRKAPATKPTPGLSVGKQRLLALRLKQRASSSWFPGCPSEVSARLFCFPHAGAGALAYRAWQLSGYVICPVLSPGREARAAEPPYERMPDLSAALAEAMRPLVTPETVFFGHSMGAGVAFEVTRALRRAGAPLPRALVVSGARPPQFRIDRPEQPELSDDELASGIQSLGGVPQDLPQFLTPALRADIRLYRNYRYEEEPPLPLMLIAYSGVSDPNVSPEQMGEWRVQTSGAFRQRTFPGGHFYLRDVLPDVLDALHQDLTPASS